MLTLELVEGMNLRIKNKSGYTLHGFLEGDESDLLAKNQPVTASVVILQIQHGFLFGFNVNRKQWELPGGRIEPGESPRACALRELEEESSQRVNTLSFAGLAYMQRPSGDYKYTAVYVGELVKLQPFELNEEWQEIKIRDLSGQDDGADLIHLELLQRTVE